MSDVDQAAFRRAAGQFPGGIVVVTTSGDHSIIVGRVTAVEPPPVPGAAPAPSARNAAPAPSARNAAPAPPAREPLVHHAGRYRRLRPAED